MSTASRHPLGPLFYRPAGRSPAAVRLWAAAVILAAAGVFSVAASLDPLAGGLGTHEQLGLGPCSMPILLGIPCPTCGMTTSFAHLAHGHPLRALHAQPAGVVLAALVLAAGLAAIDAMMRGRALAINWYRVTPSWLAGGLVLVLVASWAYKLAVTFALG